MPNSLIPYFSFSSFSPPTILFHFSFLNLFKAMGGISLNVLGICEVPPCEILAGDSKPHIRLLGVGDSPEVSDSERRVGGDRRKSYW